jgi:Tryptophan-associated transmembrane protein (Trp_oprn_chp)
MTGPEPAKAPRGPRYVEGQAPKAGRLAPRQQLVFAVVGAVAAGALTLFAASRTWLVRTTPRPAPAGPLIERVSGATLSPLMPALALVALAGAGAVVATRGRWRSVVGAVITLSGLGLIVLLRSPAGTTGIASGWVLVVAVCGVAIAIVGAFTLRNGARWPTMGARYDRPGPASTTAGLPQPGPEVSTPDGEATIDDRTAGSDRPADAPATNPHIGDTGWWDAIDRGEDPTKD